MFKFSDIKSRYIPIAVTVFAVTVYYHMTLENI